LTFPSRVEERETAPPNSAPDLMPLGVVDDRGQTRWTTREMVELERSMLERAERLAAGREHTVSAEYQSQGV